LARTTAVRPEPWHDPRYAIPLAGIVLGNVPNGGSPALDSLLGRRGARALADRGPACAQRQFRTDDARACPRLRAARALPLINRMSAAGVVTPVFLLSCGSGLAAVGVVYLASMRLTDDRQRLRIDRLTTKAKGLRP
jgi:putative ABC transport system permease protein